MIYRFNLPGIALINGEDGEVIAYDNLPTKDKDFKNDEQRFHHIASYILEICKNYKVTHISIEDSFNGVNPKVGKRLARLYGAVTCLLYENNFTLIYTYTPAQWRKTVCGYGNKSKEGVYNYVCDNIIDIGIPFSEKGKNKCDDICDAICIGYCLYKKLNKK